MTSTALFLPPLALSVRQPWAWAIIHAGKDIENRSRFSVSKGAMRKHIGERFAVHASKGLTRAEYADAWAAMTQIGVTCPDPWELQRGVIIGSVRLVDIVKAHASPWFFGEHGLVLTEPEACEPVPCDGELGFFSWRDRQRAPGPIETPRWMQPPVAPITAVPERTEHPRLL